MVSPTLGKVGVYPVLTTRGHFPPVTTSTGGWARGTQTPLTACDVHPAFCPGSNWRQLAASSPHRMYFYLPSHGRYHSILSGQETSAFNLLSCRVLQGSVLCPILFILYTKALSLCRQSHYVAHQSYADDTALSH